MATPGMDPRHLVREHLEAHPTGSVAYGRARSRRPRRSFGVRRSTA